MAKVIRTLHRNIGFFLIGLVIIYSLTGILLIYRDTDFLKKKKQVEKQLKPNLEEAELGKELRIRDFLVSSTEENMIFFNEGSYDKATGKATYTTKDLPFLLTKLINLHKTMSKNALHWVTMAFGILLLFQAISSFWLIRVGGKAFKKGMYYTGAGVLLIIILMMI
jgi:hypothetical protein